MCKGTDVRNNKRNESNLGVLSGVSKVFKSAVVEKGEAGLEGM